MVEHPVIYKTLRKIEKRAPVPLVAVCMYEATALCVPGKRLPTISKLAHKHKWAFPVICGVLGVHIWFYND